MSSNPPASSSIPWEQVQRDIAERNFAQEQRDAQMQMKAAQQQLDEGRTLLDQWTTKAARTP